MINYFPVVFIRNKMQADRALFLSHYCTTSCFIIVLHPVSLLHYILFHYCTTSYFIIAPHPISLLHYILFHYCTTSYFIIVLHPISLLHYILFHYCTTSYFISYCTCHFFVPFLYQFAKTVNTLLNNNVLLVVSLASVEVIIM